MSISEAVVRHSYEQTANRLARLSLFAERGEATGYSFEVTVRQEQLATDDILNISIACRRLIDALSLRDVSLGRKISTVGASIDWLPPGDRPADISLHDTLNKIIHSSYVEIFGFTFQLQRQADVLEAYEMVIKKENYRIPPLLAVKSDRGPISFCDLRDFCLAIDEILDEASDAAGTYRIFLGETYK